MVAKFLFSSPVISHGYVKMSRIDERSMMTPSVVFLLVFFLEESNPLYVCTYGEGKGKVGANKFRRHLQMMQHKLSLAPFYTHAHTHLYHRERKSDDIQWCECRSINEHTLSQGCDRLIDQFQQ